MNIRIKPIVKGLLTYIPGLRESFSRKQTGGTNRADYCYEVWLKHLTMASAHGLEKIPGTVAELGPGDSLGIGLAAVLSGANRYYALDVVEYSSVESNLRIFDELVDMFKRRAPRPPTGWPDYDEYLDEGLFPSHILTSDILRVSLSTERLEEIRSVLADPGYHSDSISIRYSAPWSNDDIIDDGSVDLIFSQSVIEHIDDLDTAYKALYKWLCPGGMMSHQIDLGAHRLSGRWNGYRAYSEGIWKIIVGTRPYLINRQPRSTHVRLIKEVGLDLVCDLKRATPEKGIERSRLSSRWKDISDDDLTCSDIFVQARKPE